MKTKSLLEMLVGILALFGCASFEPKPIIEKKMALEKKAINREPGSIWTEASHWNQVFTDIVPRKSGDLLRIKYTDTFRDLMMRRLKKDLAKGKLESAMDETDLAVQISDVFVNGTYNVSGDRTIRFSGDQVRLKVNATIREKDLKANDTVTWDELYNLNWSTQATEKT